MLFVVGIKVRLGEVLFLNFLFYILLRCFCLAFVVIEIKSIAWINFRSKSVLTICKIESQREVNPLS